MVHEFRGRSHGLNWGSCFPQAPFWLPCVSLASGCSPHVSVMCWIWMNMRLGCITSTFNGNDVSGSLRNTLRLRLGCNGMSLEMLAIYIFVASLHHLIEHQVLASQCQAVDSLSPISVYCSSVLGDLKGRFRGMQQDLFSCFRPAKTENGNHFP